MCKIKLDSRQIAKEYYDLKKINKGAPSLAKKYNVDKDNIYRALAKEGIDDFLILTDTEKEEIITLYCKNYSTFEINLLTNKGLKQITYLLISKNLLRKRTSSKKNENIFSVIDTEEKAYWLGFLYADGYVNISNCIVELTIKDLAHLNKFKSFIGSNISIKNKKTVINGKEHINYKLSVSSKKLAIDLTKHGCFQNKSLTLMSPRNIPNNLVHHFIRGYFDGDGSVGIYKCVNEQITYNVSILGTTSILSYIRSNCCINKRKICSRNSNKAFILNYSGHNVFIYFRDYIYKDATIYLERKREIFYSV